VLIGCSLMLISSLRNPSRAAGRSDPARDRDLFSSAEMLEFHTSFIEYDLLHFLQDRSRMRTPLENLASI